MRRLPVLPVLLVLPLVLAGCGGGSDADQASTGGNGGGTVAAVGPASAQTATVAGNAKLQFAPEKVTAKVGTLALTLHIDGGVPHNIIFRDKSVGPDIPTVTSGDSTQRYTFSAPGTYDFDCDIHPGMHGEVDVTS